MYDIDTMYEMFIPKEVKVCNRYTSIPISESDKIFGSTSFGFKNKKELNHFGEQINRAIENKDSSAFSEAGVYDIPAIIGAMLGYLTGKYSLEYKMILSQAKEINDMYTKIEALLKSNKVIRFKHRKDPINASFSNVVLESPDSNKTYKLALSWFAFNPGPITDTIDDQVAKMETLPNDKDKEKYAKNAVNDFENDYKRLINQSFPEITGYKPTIVTKVYNKVQLEKVISYQKTAFSVDYQGIYTYNRTLSLQAQYLMAMEQAYQTLKARYKNNKNAMIIVNGIMSFVLEWDNIAIKYNTECMNAVTKCYSLDYKELIKIYDYLKQFA